MKRMLNQRTYADARIRRGENYSLPSLTVPDHVVSPRDLLARFKRGENISVFDPVFTDSEYIPDDIERMDRLDKIDLAREIAESVHAARMGKTKNPREASARDGLSPSKSDAERGSSGPGDGAPGADV